MGWYTLRSKIGSFSTLDVNDNAIFNKICLELLNSIAESKTKHNHHYR